MTQHVPAEEWETLVAMFVYLSSPSFTTSDLHDCFSRETIIRLISGRLVY